MTSYLERMALGKRLALFGVLGVALLAAPLAKFLTQSWEEVRVARLEREGLAPAHSLLRVVQLTQQHRGLAANVLGGNNAMESQRAAMQAEIEQAIAQFAAVLRRMDDTGPVAALWTKALADWTSLGRDVAAGEITGADSYTRHTAVIAALLEVLDRVADHYGLSLDPGADGYHMVMAVLFHMPRLTEALGQARARFSSPCATDHQCRGARRLDSARRQRSYQLSGYDPLAWQGAGSKPGPRHGPRRGRRRYQ